MLRPESLSTTTLVLVACLSLHVNACHTSSANEANCYLHSAQSNLQGLGKVQQLPEIREAHKAGLRFACAMIEQQAETTVETIDIPSALKSHELEFTRSKFKAFDQFNFQLDGIKCIIVAPKTAAKGNPWVWRARFWGHEPQFDHAMLERGWHVCYFDVGNLFGADPAIERWDKFHALTQKFGLNSKPLLEGMSRGGLIIMRWATEHPDQVCGIYADNAVMDIRSWPGGKGKGKASPRDWEQCLKVYGLTEESASQFKDGPLDRLEPLARAGVPIFALINEADAVVPPAENGDLLVERYKKLGGPVQEMRRPDLGHHPHSLKDPAPLVEFALKAFENAFENAVENAFEKASEESSAK